MGSEQQRRVRESEGETNRYRHPGLHSPRPEMLEWRKQRCAFRCHQLERRQTDWSSFADSARERRWKCDQSAQLATFSPRPLTDKMGYWAGLAVEAASWITSSSGRPCDKAEPETSVDDFSRLLRSSGSSTTSSSSAKAGSPDDDDADEDTLSMSCSDGAFSLTTPDMVLAGA